MTTDPLTSLRKELNANRSFYRETMIRENRGAAKQTTILKARICIHNAEVLKAAIKKIKKIKPVYKFTL